MSTWWRVALAAVVCSLGRAEAGEAPVAVRATDALARATDYLVAIATEGGYLWRYSEDLTERQGEGEATATQIWVQPPGTPAVGMAFLKAYEATGDQRHLDAAFAAARALVRGQLDSGGWDYKVEFDPRQRNRWAYRSDPTPKEEDQSARRNTTTYDDDNTQSALRFLLAFLEVATNRPPEQLAPVREALDYGLGKMIEAQYPNGAWPQRWDGAPHDPERHRPRAARIPDEWPRRWERTDYGEYYTLNDRAQLDCIDTLREAYRRLGERRYLDAARRGGEFLIRAQLPEPQPAWAQQYNFNMEPAWARAFEPPAISASESAATMRTLVDLYVDTGDANYLTPIPPFLDWLRRSALGPNRWARLYELGSNRPIYGDRDGLIHYTLAEISEERQSGYAWQGRFEIPEAIAYYEAVLAGKRPAPPTGLDREPAGPAPSASQVIRILEQQDDQGRWLRNGWIEMRQFIANMNLLCAYLNSHSESTRP